MVKDAADILVSRLRIFEPKAMVVFFANADVEPQAIKRYEVVGEGEVNDKFRSLILDGEVTEENCPILIYERIDPPRVKEIRLIEN